MSNEYVFIVIAIKKNYFVPNNKPISPTFDGLRTQNSFTGIPEKRD